MNKKQSKMGNLARRVQIWPQIWQPALLIFPRCGKVTTMNNLVSDFKMNEKCSFITMVHPNPGGLIRWMSQCSQEQKDSLPVILRVQKLKSVPNSFQVSTIINQFRGNSYSYVVPMLGTDQQAKNSQLCRPTVSACIYVMLLFQLNIINIFNG